ncbi:hypothetical protein BVX95_00490 [archaeon D22]|nr:hypothetical protein BVX95_00490 [archaeon D22]
MNLKNFLKSYSNFVSKHPFVIVALVILFSVLMVSQMGNLRFENEDNNDMLPDGISVMDEFEYISNQFAGTDALQILVSLEPSVSASTQPRDIRSVDIVEYVELIGQKIELLEDVRSVDSVSNTLKSLNDDKLPKGDREIKELLVGFEGSVISKDYETTLLTINLENNVDAAELYKDLKEILETTPKPSKIKTQLSGDLIVDLVMEETFGPDMSKTSNFALLGILIVVLIIFRSIKYGFTPLTTIIFANMWSFGLLAIINLPISSVMTGVSSMIMGIGIDFGIQVVYRFKYEMKTKTPSEAMSATLENVIIPMSTTTLAALIGFRAMSLGQLTMMADIGTMMSFGVMFSMLAALTFVPAILVIGETYSLRNYLKKIIGG